MMCRALTTLLIAVAAYVAIAVPAMAQTVRDCGAAAIGDHIVASPVPGSTRAFSGGDLQVSVLDEGPDATGSGMFGRGAVHLRITYETLDKPSEHCALISASGHDGFHSVDITEMTVLGDPAQMAILDIPVTVLIGGDMLFRHNLFLTINGALGTVVAGYDTPAH